MALFNGFRFMQCSSWELLSSTPNNTSEVLGAVKNTPYIKTNTGQVLCLVDLEWSNCITPSFGFQSTTAPFWTMKSLSQNFVEANIKQIIRSDGYLQTDYYSLLSNGNIFSCSTSLENEINKIFSSSKLFWLLIPMIGFGLSISAFFKSFAQEGDPSYWDFWGRGLKIK
jgi:hypothetical protein